MRLLRTGATPPRMLASTEEETLDLTAADPAVTSFRDIAARAAEMGGIEAVVDALRPTAPVVSTPASTALRRPLVADEVWAAGVTYAISEQAREAESALPEMYMQVYDAERPEIFFKATPSRTVGPHAAVGVRTDSTWDVPEPELGVVLYEGAIVGYTIGNDVSSRSIEGANPLYLPQAKVYDRCCAIGPAVTTAASLDASDLEMSMQILRDGEQLYADRTSTAELHRTIDELVSYTIQSDAVPELMVLLTGTSLVPEEGFTLRPGDTVRITIEGIGTLENGVIEV